jgi:hypothetical protein
MAPDEDVVDAVIEGLIRFETAFRPVLAETINAGGDDHLVAKYLSLCHKCSFIAINCCLGPELLYDNFTA